MQNEIENETLYQCPEKNCGERCERKRPHTHKTERSHRTNRFGCPPCQPIPSPAPEMTIEEASKIVERGVGSRPDFPRGKDYVDEVRHGKPSPAQSQPENPEPILTHAPYHYGSKTQHDRDAEYGYNQGIQEQITRSTIELVAIKAYWVEAGKASVKIPTIEEIADTTSRILCEPNFSVEKLATAIVALIEGKE